MSVTGNRDPDEDLIEAVAGAWRPRGEDEVKYHPNWYDLDEEGRRRAFDLAAALRPLEAALDPEGLSPTARAVLARIRGSTG